MAGKVKLSVKSGPQKGQVFVFDSVDRFMFGRHPDCHCRITDDPLVSRHQFLLEVIPPIAQLKDLGSLNGTYVNGQKHGGRQAGESPEEAARRPNPAVAIQHGHSIVVGLTEIAVSVEQVVACKECGAEIPPEALPAGWARMGEGITCARCRLKQAVAQPAAKPQSPEAVRCVQCGKDVSQEAGPGRKGVYICKACQQQQAHGNKDKELWMALARLLGVPIPAQAAEGQMPSIPGYDYVKTLGEGAFGKVYLARRQHDGLPVAVKVMLANVAVSEENRKRFLREAEVTKAISHENLVTFMDSGSVGNVFYFMMEYCEAGGLEGLAKAKGGKLPVGEAVPLMIQALRGLEFMHKQGFVHRDLKPQNILLRGSGGRLTAKISDFGLSKSFQSSGLSGFTATGTAAGTPQFMPPEQLSNFKYVKPPSDVWSMAATLYNMLSGGYPLHMPQGVLWQSVVLDCSVIPLEKRLPSIPRGLAQVIHRGLAKNVKERYQDAGEFSRALETAL